MPFPYSFRGSISAPRPDLRSDARLIALARAVRLFEGARDPFPFADRPCYDVEVAGARLVARAKSRLLGAWRGPLAHPLTGVDYAVIAVAGTSQCAEVRYDLRLGRTIAILVALSAVLTVLLAAAGVAERGWSTLPVSVLSGIGLLFLLCATAYVPTRLIATWLLRAALAPAGC